MGQRSISDKHPDVRVHKSREYSPKILFVELKPPGNPNLITNVVKFANPLWPFSSLKWKYAPSSFNTFALGPFEKVAVA